MHAPATPLPCYDRDTDITSTELPGVPPYLGILYHSRVPLRPLNTHRSRCHRLRPTAPHTHICPSNRLSFSHLHRSDTEIISSLPLDQHPDPGQVPGLHATLPYFHDSEQSLPGAEVRPEHAVRRRLQTSGRRVLVSEREGDLVSSHEEYARSCRGSVGKTAVGLGRYAASAEKEMERCRYRWWYNEETE